MNINKSLIFLGVLATTGCSSIAANNPNEDISLANSKALETLMKISGLLSTDKKTVKMIL